MKQNKVGGAGYKYDFNNIINCGLPPVVVAEPSCKEQLGGSNNLFNNITHPITNQQHSIFSKQGKQLLKQYVKTINNLNISK